MKIKLIAPKLSLRPMDTELKRILAPSLGLLTLAALTPNHHCVDIADENTGPLDLDDQPDLVGITVTVDSAYRAYELADHYQARGIPTVLGGIHASACPEEAKAHCHAVCIGNAEPVWHHILDDATARTLKPYYHSTAKLDTGEIPLPAWSSINQNNYLYCNVLAASRGCPYRCDFCYNSCDYRSHRYAPRPVDAVIHEIRQLRTRHVMFVDDNLIGDITWIRELIRAMIPLKLKWNAAVSANLVHHEDLLDLMVESGCHSLFIGFESITEGGLRDVGKRQNNVTDYERLVEMIHSRGIMINASLVFGLDDHTPAVFQHTLDWLVANKIETMTAHIMTPYPGTKLRKRLVSEDRVVDYNWANYNTSNVVFKPKHMTPTELRKGYLWIYKAFYSVPNILRRLPKSRRQQLPYLLFNVGYRKFGRLTAWLSKISCMATIGRLGRRLAYGLE